MMSGPSQPRQDGSSVDGREKDSGIVALIIAYRPDQMTIVEFEHHGPVHPTAVICFFGSHVTHTHDAPAFEGLRRNGK